MDDSTYIRYDNLGELDSSLTAISSVEGALFLGNSYGDIRILRAEKSEILHNHSGVITSLAARASRRTGVKEGVYLLSGTSIGNVYLHLVFPDRISSSRILYKFVTGYAVFSICLHPDFELFNFRRLTKRLTVDFREEVSREAEGWSQLKSSALTPESFVIALSNGSIYLVQNAVVSPRESGRSAGALGRHRDERHEIMYVTSYLPYVNMKIGWYNNYLSWLDRAGFYVLLLPSFESILYISNEYFNDPGSRKREKQTAITTRNLHYLYNIIDNNDLYASTDESDLNPIGSIESSANVFATPTHQPGDLVSINKLRRSIVNYKYSRHNERLGVISNFKGDSILLGCHNILLSIRLVSDSDTGFGENLQLLLNTCPSRESISYKNVKNSITKVKRSTELVRGYIEYKLILPERFDILHILYNGQNQFDLIVLNDAAHLDETTLRRRLRCEKYNNDGTVYRYKIGVDPRADSRDPLMNLMFNFNLPSKRNYYKIHSESILLDDFYADSERENFIATSFNDPRTDCVEPPNELGGPYQKRPNRGSVYLYIYSRIVHVNYCNNCVYGLKHYISAGDREGVVAYFRENLPALLASKNKDLRNFRFREYLLEFVHTFADYSLGEMYYDGFKLILELLSAAGKLGDLLELVFTERLRKRLEVAGFYHNLVDEITALMGNETLMHLTLITWNLKPDVYNALLNRVKKMLIKYIYHLYHVYQDSGPADDAASTNSTLKSDNYFNLLIVLSNLNSKDRVTVGNIYNLLHQFFLLTSGTEEVNLADPELLGIYGRNGMVGGPEDAFLGDDTHHGPPQVGSSMTDCYGDGQTRSRLEDEPDADKKLAICEVERETLYLKLLSLRYYYKSLGDELVSLKTRGSVYCTEDARSRAEPENGGSYIQKNLITCNICTGAREAYNEVVTKLVNRVGGDRLTLPKLNSILYFSCKHLVHERCQIKLINQLHVSSEPRRHTPFNSTALLGTCLSCLTRVM